MPPWLSDVLLPGAHALAQGRLASALILLPPALIAAGMLLAASAIAPEHAAALRWSALALWLVLAAGAVLGTARWRRRRAYDPVAVRRVHAEFARAYISGAPQDAVGHARRLTTLAPEAPGAWRLLELAASAAGDATLAARARSRAARCLPAGATGPTAA